MTKPGFPRHFGVFLLLSAFGMAQLGWWVIFQVREGTRVHREQSHLWEQQISMARQWAAQFNPAPQEFRAWLSAFPDLEVTPDGQDVQVTGAAKAQLDQIANKRVRMFIFEGAFFSLLVGAGVIYIYWTLHKEVDFERREAMFLSATSHELRTPLTSLRLYLETLRDRELPPAQKTEVLETMAADTERLNDLIDRLLQAQAVTNPARKPLLRMTDLAEETAAAIEHVKPLFDHGGFELRTSLQPGLMAMTEPTWYQTIVKNLLENAYKYSPNGGSVDLELSRAGTRARLVVRDRGIGLDHGEAERIFEKFYRVENEDTRRTRGTGLGLYLVQRMAEAFGGRAHVSSPGLGKGATFTVELPLAAEVAHA
ncbi:MAG TPA: HAMP domain-containing sensor histidine kinase [bacterium]